MKLEFEYLPVDQLTPYDKNARKHADFDVAIIKKSIEKFGFNDPIGIWGKANIIVEGHGRLLAAQELGMKEVPVIRLDHLNDQERKMYALEHNRSAEMSTWDMETLMDELSQLTEFDLNELGFSEFLLDEDDGEAGDDDFNEDDFITEVQASQTGDIFLLGEHRLICGDCTNPELVETLMDGKIADLVLTDPPYNVDYEGSNGDTIANDNLSETALHDLFINSFSLMFQHSKNGANAFVFHRDIETQFQICFKESGFKLAQMWIWRKNSFTLGRGWAQYQHEPILVGWKEGESHYMSGARDLSTVLDFDKPKHNDLHPTMKPLELIGYLIKEASRKHELVIDFFGGSGSTLIAADQLDRKCYTMEKLPKYADVIVKRYIRHKGSADGCFLIREGKKTALPQEFTSILG